MSDDELLAIEQLAAKATPGPWYAVPNSAETSFGYTAEWMCLSQWEDDACDGFAFGEHGFDDIDAQQIANFDFLAAARTAVPALIAEVRRLQGAIKAECDLSRGDGTDRLLTVLYGESSALTIGKAIGGSCARMLFDAADKIERLRKALLEKENR